VSIQGKVIFVFGLLFSGFLNNILFAADTVLVNLYIHDFRINNVVVDSLGEVYFSDRNGVFQYKEGKANLYDSEYKEILSLNDQFITQEAYALDDEIQALAIDFYSITNGTGYELRQNTPNPFNTETMVEFVLPQTENLMLQITNIEGRLIKEIRANFEKGTHQIKLDRSFIKEEGVYYYTLKAGDFYATRKMIVID
jgi:hypothetical protein